MGKTTFIPTKPETTRIQVTAFEVEVLLNFVRDQLKYMRAPKADDDKLARLLLKLHRAGNRLSKT